MRTFKSSNPAVRAFERIDAQPSAIPMTVQGTINKTILLFLLTVLTATLTWRMVMAGNFAAMTLMWVGLIGGLVTALITIFNMRVVHITAPIYALFEGLALGAISAVLNTISKGIAFQAVILTFAVFTVMLVLYKTGILKATPGFVKGVVAATAGIALFYLVSFIGSFFGLQLSVFNMGIFGIGIQIVIVAIAALNLILDFSFIETGAGQGLPKRMEWYGAFSLMVTLIWLYLEILRLLALFSRNN